VRVADRPETGPIALQLLEQFHFRCVGNRSVENNFGTRIP
jgi:hypothetical protein